MEIMPLWLKFGWVFARSSVAISVRMRYLLITDLVLGLTAPLSFPYVHVGGRGRGRDYILLWSFPAKSSVHTTLVGLVQQTTRSNFYWVVTQFN